MGPGAALPLCLLAYGVHAIVTQHAVFSDAVEMTFLGRNAIAFGTAWVSAGLFMHCHYFWGNLYDQG